MQKRRKGLSAALLPALTALGESSQGHGGQRRREGASILPPAHRQRHRQHGLTHFVGLGFAAVPEQPHSCEIKLHFCIVRV
jgi:hypothetical protein